MIFFKLTLKLTLAVLLAMSFTYCSNSNNDEPYIDEPEISGEIPGFGETKGELTGAPFALPSGVRLVGAIKGYEGSDAELRVATTSQKQMASSKESALRNAEREADVIVGSGHTVVIHFELANTTSRAIEVNFPALMVVKAKTLGGKNVYQNGVLLKKTKVEAPAQSTIHVALMMYCANSSRKASEANAEYEWSVVSDSPILIDLANKLANKKINIEEYPEQSLEDRLKYAVMLASLQDILWKLTDNFSILVTDADAYIASLPNSER